MEANTLEALLKDIAEKTAEVINMQAIKWPDLGADVYPLNVAIDN